MVRRAQRHTSLLRNNRARFVLVGGIVAVLLVTGVVGYHAIGNQEYVVSSSSPLGEATSTHIVDCHHVTRSGSATLGSVILSNKSSQAVTVTSVSLYRNQGVMIKGDALIVPQLSDTAIGNYSGYPPTLAKELAPSWALRRPAVGFEIVPSRTPSSNPYVDIVLQITRSGSRDGSFAGVIVEYKTSARKYKYVETWGMILYSGDCSSPSAPNDVPYPSK